MKNLTEHPYYFPKEPLGNEDMERLAAVERRLEKCESAIEKDVPWFIYLLWTVALVSFCTMLGTLARAQDTDPQTSYAATVLYNQPSLYLNFNDFSTSFLDQISGLSFGPSSSSPSTVGGLPASVTATGANPRIYMLNTDFSGPGAVSTIKVQFDTAPSAGAQYQILVATDNGSGSYTITAEPTTITVAATTAVQTFDSGTGFTAFNVLAGQTIGFVVPTSYTGIGYAAGGTTNYYSLSTGTIPTIGVPTTYTVGGGSVQLAISATVNSATVTSPGTTTPRQPGFDATTPTNYSAEFTYNAWNAAPNTTLGVIDWDVPWTMMVHIDRLNWNRTGYLMLASKGDLGACVGSINTCNVTQPFWQLFLRMNGLYSQLCYMRSGNGTTVGESGGSTLAQNGICTNATFDAMPNGFNYDIMVTDTGTGASYPNCSGCTAPLNLYINGLNGTYIPVTSFTNTYSQGFGYTALSIGSGGSGYTVNTAFTSTGGGANCVVSGVATESGGALTGIYSTSNNYGCTSNPTIVLTAPTGTGGSITAVAQTTTMNSSTLPLMIPGYVSSGTFEGIDPSDSTQAPTYIDEAAIFGALSQTAIQSIFYHTTFFEIPLSTKPANPIAFIFSDDGCGDFDNATALQVAISAQRYGYLHIEGVEFSDPSASAAGFIYRQMLDQAGLANIPMATTATGSPTYSGWCTPPNITTYNASTPQVFSAYPSSVTMYRTVLAAHPTTPVMIFSAGALTGISDFLQSAADSISPLTGQQLWDQDAANGGAIYLQGGPTCNPPTYCTTTSTVTSDNVLEDPVAGQYVMANHGAMPMYLLGGTPSDSGPGPLYTRTSKDPMFLAAVAWGGDTRQGWDSLPISSLLSNLFWGGNYITYSGGTGYANSTPFTLSGGGTNCAGSGIMTASGGVPNGIKYIWGANAQIYQGLGNGCTSAPTINLVGATGTGVTLTAYPTSVCVTDRVTESGGVYYDGVNSTTCDNQYVQPFSQYAAPAGTGLSWPIFSGFLNSWIDPPPNGAPKVQ